MDNRLIVLSLCDYTCNMLAPWAADGRFQCIAVDLQHSSGDVLYPDGIKRVCADVRNYLPPLGVYAACFAFPPCTHLAISGARWFKEKGLSELAKAIELVEACRQICEWTNAPYMIENPVSTLSTYWRKPDYIFNPCDFGGYLDPPGDAYTKKTCLWVGNGFIMPDKKTVAPVFGSKMHRLSPSPDRANLRSETPMGFANAVYQALVPSVIKKAS